MDLGHGVVVFEALELGGQDVLLVVQGLEVATLLLDLGFGGFDFILLPSY